jgi:nucleotide-binding universal stress UspA family protein
MKRILVATDGSESAGRAIDFAAALAKDAHADLLIANVIGGYGLPGEVFRRFTQSQTAWLEELLQAHSAEVLTEARERTLRLGVAAVEIESRAGDVAQTLSDLAAAKGVDAIVVGRRGAGGVATLLLGSAAHKLVSLATLPIVVVP